MDIDPCSSPTPTLLGRGINGRVPATDGRSWQSCFRRRMKADLLAHIEGDPSPMQACLIDAASDVALEIESMRRRRDTTGALSIHDAKVFLSYQNVLRRHLLGLGIKGGRTKEPTLADYLKSKDGGK